MVNDSYNYERHWNIVMLTWKRNITRNFRGKRWTPRCKWWTFHCHIGLPKGSHAQLGVSQNMGTQKMVGLVMVDNGGSGGVPAFLRNHELVHWSIKQSTIFGFPTKIQLNNQPFLGLIVGIGFIQTNIQSRFTIDVLKNQLIQVINWLTGRRSSKVTTSRRSKESLLINYQSLLITTNHSKSLTKYPLQTTWWTISS